MDKYSSAHLNAQHPKVEEVASGKGYVADIDRPPGCIYARFPPHFPDQPDRGFLWGLKNVAETLEALWNQERVRRMKGSATSSCSSSSCVLESSIHSIYEPEHLPPLSAYGKEIFAEVFGEDNEDLEYISKLNFDRFSHVPDYIFSSLPLFVPFPSKASLISGKIVLRSS